MTDKIVHRDVEIRSQEYPHHSIGVTVKSSLLLPLLETILTDSCVTSKAQQLVSDQRDTGITATDKNKALTNISRPHRNCPLV